MTKRNGCEALLVLLLLWTTAIGVNAQTFTSLLSFSGPDGEAPVGSLVQGADGSFYGTTLYGGANSFGEYCSYGCGTVFKIDAAGTLTTLYNFCAQPDCRDGGAPTGLVLGFDGNFYGTTEGGGTLDGGTAFRITPGGVLTKIYNFCKQRPCPDGEEPTAPLAEGPDGGLYGTSVGGGAYENGVVFELKPSGNGWTEAVLYSFCHLPHCADGSGPIGGLVLGPDGNFYGTTQGGGTASGSNCGVQQYGCGTVFKVTPTGTLTTLHSFCLSPSCPDGAFPEDGLVQALDGNFYGTTPAFGVNGGGTFWGTVFRITRNGELVTTYNFCTQPNCADGISPSGLMQATDGNLYGTTTGGGDISCQVDGCGTLFEITAPKGKLITLHDFEYTDGYFAVGALLQATTGNFYGTTLYGGEGTCGQYSCGTAFSLSMGLGPFVAFVRPFGKVGQTGGILGQGFTGTTSVMLNGVPANFTVVSDTYIKATVPPGATTGDVTVTTPTGVLTSNVPFRVIH